MNDPSSGAYWSNRAKSVVSLMTVSGPLQDAVGRSLTAYWTRSKVIGLISTIAVKNYVPPIATKRLAEDFAARQTKVLKSVASPSLNATKSNPVSSQALTEIIANNTVIGSQLKFGSVRSLLNSIDFREIGIEDANEQDDSWELRRIVDDEFEHLSDDVRETLTDQQRIVIRKTIQVLLTFEPIFVPMIV